MIKGLFTEKEQMLYTSALLLVHQNRKRLNPIYIFVNGVAGFISAR